MLTTSPALNAGIVIAAVILVAGLICAGWAVVEHLRTLAARRRRAEAKTEREAARAAASLSTQDEPGLTVEQAFARFAHRHHVLDARLDDIAAGVEIEEESAS